MNSLLLNHGKKPLEKFPFSLLWVVYRVRDDNMDSIKIAAEKRTIEIDLTLTSTTTAQNLSAYWTEERIVYRVNRTWLVPMRKSASLVPLRSKLKGLKRQIMIQWIPEDTDILRN